MWSATFPFFESGSPSLASASPRFLGYQARTGPAVSTGDASLYTGGARIYWRRPYKRPMPVYTGGTHILNVCKCKLSGKLKLSDGLLPIGTKLWCQLLKQSMLGTTNSSFLSLSICQEAQNRMTVLPPSRLCLARWRLLHAESSEMKAMKRGQPRLVSISRTQSAASGAAAAERAKERHGWQTRRAFTRRRIAAAERA